MRNNIYYWKCDSPHTVEAKKRLYFKEKYDREGLADIVREACSRAFGAPVREVEPLRVDGNHMAFVAKHGGKPYFFRADDGTGDDDYILAESAVMRLAADAGVPAPRVYHTDASRKHCPFRFQIMDFCHDPCLNDHYKQGTLNLDAVAPQIGQYMHRLHSIRLEGFGFVNTHRLTMDGHVQGLDATYPDYFRKRLDEHIGYLRRHALLSGQECDEVMRQFRRHEPRLDREKGVLVHRDMALWNIMGAPDRVSVVIDWDDAVSGDPADDLGVLGCFHDERFMDALLGGYWDGGEPPEDFLCRVWLHTLRNMLWKTMLRHSLGYFEKGRDFFLNTPDVQGSLKDHTLAVLRNALEKTGSFDSP